MACVTHWVNLCSRLEVICPHHLTKMASTAKKARAILESHRLFPQISKPSRRRSNEKITRQTHSFSLSKGFNSQLLLPCLEGESISSASCFLLSWKSIGLLKKRCSRCKGQTVDIHSVWKSLKKSHFTTAETSYFWRENSNETFLVIYRHALLPIFYD